MLTLSLSLMLSPLQLFCAVALASSRRYLRLLWLLQLLLQLPLLSLSSLPLSALLVAAVVVAVAFVLLLLLWCLLIFCCASCPEQARAICWAYDGNCSEHLMSIAKCGNWGRTPTNTERDFHRFARRCLAFDIEKYFVPVRADRGHGVEIVSIPMFPIHEYLAAVWGTGQDRFTETCFSSDGLPSLDRFWKHVSHMSWARNHPAQSDPARMPFTIPVCFFGDDARVYKSEKMLVWEMVFMLSKSTLAKFVVGVLPYWMVVPGVTLQDAHSALRWMFQCGLDGVYATNDHLGRPITKAHGELRFSRRGQPLCLQEPRFRIAFTGFKADLQYEKITFKFHSYDQLYLCRNCRAHKTDPALLYTNTGEGAPWRLHPRTTQEYFDEANNLDQLVLIPGWCLEMHRYDPMHLIFLGFGLHLVGSCILDLLGHGHWPGGAKKVRLRQAWHHAGLNSPLLPLQAIIFRMSMLG